MMLKRFVWLLVVGMMVFGADVVLGQSYPDKPIRMVTSEAGGSTDTTARLIAQGLTRNLGQQVIVDNRGGASGVIAAELVARAKPDGYTLLIYSNGFWTLPLLKDNLSYDPLRDFIPITLPVTTPNMIAVHPSLPVSSVKELIALAKAQPGKLNYSSGGTGSSNHIAAELFKSMAGVNIVRIPFKSTGPALNSLIAGEVQMMFVAVNAGMPHVNSGRLKALAVTSAEPSMLAPGVPTAAASGLPGYETALTTGMFVPAKTPATIINRLHQETVRAIKSADLKERLFNSGVEVVGSSPEQSAATIKSEMDRLSKLFKEAGIKAN